MEAVGASGGERSTLSFAGCFRGLADKCHLPCCSRLKMAANSLTFLYSEAGSEPPSLEPRWAYDYLDQQNTAEVMCFQVVAQAWRDCGFYLLSCGALSCHVGRSHYFVW